MTDTSDNIRTILDVAQEVVEECAPDPGNTRLERLARWCMANIGTPNRHLADVTWLDEDAEARIHTRYGTFGVDFARELAVDLLRAVDRAEHLDD